MPSDLDYQCTPVVTGKPVWLPPEATYPVDDDAQKWLAISYATCVFIVFAFAAYAIIMYYRRMKMVGRDQDNLEFCTAKGTQGRWRITYSFFAGAVGAWCIASPSSFAVYSGILGLAMYSFASGMPVLMLALCGAQIQKMHGDTVSVGDFVGRRFGPTFKLIVALICLFNMSIAMLAEYTTIGSLFSDFVGSYAWPMIITVGILTMGYTMYGGLYISIITDQVQAIVTIIFIAILSIYVAVTFRPPGGLPKPLPNDIEFGQDPETGYVNWPLGVNKFGYSAIFSMPCALMAATVFSEAMWQKVWASENRSALLFGGCAGSILIMLAVFIFGLFGWLAAWAGYVGYYTNTNLFLFQVFSSDVVPVQDPYYPDFIYSFASARVRSWIGVVTLILAVTMNTGAIDSLQNGITSALSTHFFKNQNIAISRLIVIIINVPIMIVATKKYTILQLFLIANMLTTCWFLPVLAGLWDSTAHFVGETGCCFGGSVAILTTIAYSTGRIWYKASNGQQAIECGAWYAWYGDINYDWDQFLVAAGSSVVAMIIWGSIASLLRRCGIRGPGISGVLKHIPGFKFMTGDGLDFDLMEKVGLGRFNAPKPDIVATVKDDAETKNGAVGAESVAVAVGA